MVNIDKILKLGGFFDTAVLPRLGFARKGLPPDTAHDDSRKKASSVNKKVVPTDQQDPDKRRDIWIKAAAEEEDVAKRADLTRSIAHMAQNGDAKAAEAVLEIMKTDPSVEVRKTAASYLMFAAHEPKIPYNKRIIEGLHEALNDEDARIRVFAVQALEISWKERDTQDVDSSIEPQVKGVLGRAEAIKSRNTAWAEVAELSQAVRNRPFVDVVLDFLTNDVLPVRMGMWESIAAVSPVKNLKACVQKEARFQEMAVLQRQLRARHAEFSQALNERHEIVMEGARERLRHEIQEQERIGVVFDDFLVKELQAKVFDAAVREDEEEGLIRDQNEIARGAVEEAKLKLERAKESHEILSSSVEEAFLGIIMCVLKMDSQGGGAAETVNKRLRYIQSGNWFIRRAAMRALFPLTELGDARALAMIAQGKKDSSPYVRRAANKQLIKVRRMVADREKREQELRMGINKPVPQRVAEPPASPIWPDSPADHKQSSSTHHAPKPATRPETTVTIAQPELEEAPDEGLADNLSSLLAAPEHKATLEEERVAKKEKKKEILMAQEAQRIRLLDIKNLTIEELVSFFNRLRDKMDPRLIDNACAKIRTGGLTGAIVSDYKDSDWKQMGFALNAARSTVTKALEDMKNELFEATDPGALMASAEAARIEASRRAAKELAQFSRLKQKDKVVAQSRLRAALRADAFMYGGSSGLRCVLFRDQSQNVYMKSVKPCGGVVNESDVLIKVGDKEVTGMSLLQVRQLLSEYGQMCPCVVRLMSQKERMEVIKNERRKADEEIENLKLPDDKQKRSRFFGGRRPSPEKQAQVLEEERNKLRAHLPPNDLVRSIQITVVPTAFKDQYLEAIGLDIEVFNGDATRSLQVITLLQRNGFGAYINRMLVELEVRQIKELASKFCFPDWIRSVGLTPPEEKRFTTLLRRLAVRFRISDPRSAISTELKRPDAHNAWRYVQARAGATQFVYGSKMRQVDMSRNLEEFTKTGNSHIPLVSAFNGLAYTVLWHEGLGLYVELMHTSTGAFRIMRDRRVGDDEFHQPLDPDRPEFPAITVYSDGTLEPVRSLRAPELIEVIKEVRNGGEVPSLDQDHDVSSRDSSSRGGRSSSKGGSFRASSSRGSYRHKASSRHGASFKHLSGSSMKHMMHNDDSGSSGDEDAINSLFDDSLWIDLGRKSVNRRESVAGSLKNFSAIMSEEGSLTIGSQMNAKRNSDAVFLNVARSGDQGFDQGSSQTRVDDSFQKQSAKNNFKSILKTRPQEVNVAGGNFGGIKTFLDSLLGGAHSGGIGGRMVAEGEEIGSDEEDVIGYHIAGEVGQRVRIRPRLADSLDRSLSSLASEVGFCAGTIIWVDDEDADGDGVTGDIVQVKWDTGLVSDYKTGFEGQYRLILDNQDVKGKGNRKRDLDADADEKIVGLDLPPEEGMRVMLRRSAIAENPDILHDSNGGGGVITWVDPTDADGDGVTGDICEVLWDLTKQKDDYRTGFEGHFRLRLEVEADVKKQAAKKKKQKAKSKSPSRPTSPASKASKTRVSSPKSRPESAKSKKWGGVRTLDQDREDVPDDPWESLAEALKTAHEIMYASPPAVDTPKDATRLEAEGTHSELTSGNWHLKTESHGEYGTSISVFFGSGLTFDKERARKDALNLGLSSSCLDRKSFTSSKQGERKCTFGEDKSAELHLTGDAILCFIPPKEKGKNTSAFMISEDGLEYIEEDEAKLLLDGVPRSMVEEVLQAERNRINVADTDSEA